ncbi:MAG: FG-GAP repeat protein [Planctomycetota bacterium]
MRTSPAPPTSSCAGSTWSQQAYLKASNTDAFDQFGTSVAVSGDTVVVGAITQQRSSSTVVDGNQADSGADLAGAAYVFVRSGSTWSQQAYLKASNTDAFDRFGTSVAVSGDTIVVGATDEDSGATGIDGNQADNSAPGSGAAYVFVRSGSTWSQQAYQGDLQGSGRQVRQERSRLGKHGRRRGANEVSNARGCRREPGRQQHPPQSGAVYVFVRSGSTWSQRAYIKASNTEAGDGFGTSVAVGRHGRRGRPAEQQRDRREQDPVRQRRTGSRRRLRLRTLRRDLDPTGLSPRPPTQRTISLVAASRSRATRSSWAPFQEGNATGIDGNQADNSALLAGAAYVFVRSGTAWSQQAYLKGSNTEAGDGRYERGGLKGDTVVVGAPAEGSSATGVNGIQSDNSVPGAGAACDVRALRSDLDPTGLSPRPPTRGCSITSVGA